MPISICRDSAIKASTLGIRIFSRSRRASSEPVSETEVPAVRLVAEGGHPWHGYPAWPIMRLDRGKKERKYPAPREALEKMKQAGLITENQRKRLASGKHTR
jgi:hypothetical protein